MSKQSRRDFLRSGMVAGGALALSPLGIARAQEAAGTAAPTALQMCITRWKGDLDPASAEAVKAMAIKLTEQVIAALGGMQRFVTKGDIVWIKPNIAWNRAPEFAANTNPDVVAAVARMCYEAGAKRVKVGDRPCHPDKDTYPVSGIEAAAKAVDAEVVYLDDNRFREVELKGERLDKWALYPEIIESDLVINVPIAKHHSISTVTAGMKNYMGVAGGQRGQWHQDLPACLCDVTAFMKPRLTILDATRILAGNGPTGGNLSDVKHLNTIAAGTDIVAIDALASELLGHKPAEVKTIAAASKRGLGQMDYRALALSELEVS